MKLLTWNVQWCRGIDGVVDVRRIVDHARRLADFDVLCLQEVVSNFGTLPGAPREDQFAAIAAMLPGFTAVEAVGVDVPAPEGGRRRFGNLLLSRYPVLRVLRHQLPWTVDPDHVSMPRVVAEAVLETPLGPVTVMNTHLEYFSAAQRAAQVEALRHLYAEACARATGSRTVDTTGSQYHAYPASTQVLIAGDFNVRPETPEHRRMQDPFEAGVPRLADAWQHLHGDDAPRPPTVGVYERSYWPGPDACDFLFASEPLLPRLVRLTTDVDTQASDHQPQLLELS